MECAAAPEVLTALVLPQYRAVSLGGQLCCGHPDGTSLSRATVGKGGRGGRGGETSISMGDGGVGRAASQQHKQEEGGEVHLCECGGAS